MTKQDMRPYLQSSRYIDWETPAVMELAQTLSANLGSDEEIARACFEWVRDTIKHSADYQLNPVTCQASEVLKQGTGYCYAKSHLLAALLRANNIPAGLCYQRLSVDDTGPPYCLHGLNAVYLKAHGWYRMDARGNTANVHAQFVPPREQLAFPISLPGERDLPEIWPEPLPIVTSVLERYDHHADVYRNLPDITLIRQ